MNKMSKSERFQILLKKKEALKTHIASIEARGNVKQTKKMKRIKILAGAYFIEKYKDKMDELAKIIDEFLMRDNDRKLFWINPMQKIMTESHEKIIIGR
jgi:hypothetical protein